MPQTPDSNKRIKTGRQNFAELCNSSGEITAGEVTQLLHKQNIIIYSQLQPSPTLTLRPLFLVAPSCTCAGKDLGDDLRPDHLWVPGPPCRDWCMCLGSSSPGDEGLPTRGPTAVVFGSQLCLLPVGVSALRASLMREKAYRCRGAFTATGCL